MADEKTSSELHNNKTFRFKWSVAMIKDLINALQEFKTLMEYNAMDFNADKPRQYEEVRRLLSQKYEAKYFGPTVPDPADAESKKLLNQGYKRVLEKTKELRQSFSSAVTKGTRSGSGKLVLEFYDELVSIWGGSASANPLFFGRESCDNGSEIHASSSDKSVSEISYESDGNDNGTYSTLDTSDRNDNNSRSDEGNGRNNEDNNSNDSSAKSRLKRKIVPKLIDAKRKHLERNLSAKERDNLLLKESKEDALFRRELCQTIKESNTIFATAMNSMSQAMSQMADCMSQTMKQMTNYNQYQPATPRFVPNQFQRNNIQPHDMNQSSYLAYMNSDDI